MCPTLFLVGLCILCIFAIIILLHHSGYIPNNPLCKKKKVRFGGVEYFGNCPSGSKGDRGPAGPQGPQGPQGPPGNYEKETEFVLGRLSSRPSAANRTARALVKDTNNTLVMNYANDFDLVNINTGKNGMTIDGDFAVKGTMDIPRTCRNISTKYTNSGTIDILDTHDLKCNDNEALVQFLVDKNKQNQIRLTGRCCSFGK